jgi:predicted DNA-binding transcriptional regulator YafY
MSKYDRLLHILNLVRARRNLRTKDLAEECDVCERTIYRDIYSLSSAQIPIYFDDGYKLASDSFIPPLNLTLEEYRVLRLGLTASPLMETPVLKQAAKAVLAKITAGLSSKLKEKLKGTDQSIKILSTCHDDFSKQKLTFQLLMQCIYNYSTIRISYDLSSDKRVDLTVDPYSLVFRNHSWYLVGFCNDCQEATSFRLTQIKRIALTDRNFRPPAGFSLFSFFSDAWEVEQGRTVKVKIRFSGKAAKSIRSTKYHHSQMVTKRKDGSTIYAVAVKGVEEIFQWILGFGENAEVLEPKELREKIKSTIKNMSKIYCKTE